MGIISGTCLNKVKARVKMKLPAALCWIKNITANCSEEMLQVTRLKFCYLIVDIRQNIQTNKQSSTHFRLLLLGVINLNPTEF